MEDVQPVEAAETPENSGSSEATPQTPPPNETFAQKLERLGGLDPDDSSPEPQASESKAAKPTPKAKSATPQGGDKLAQLRELAKELNFEVQDGAISIKERQEFRDWKKRQTEALSTREAQLQKQLQDALAEAKPKIDRADAFSDALDKGDILAAAKVMGFESWDDLQKHLIAQTTDPNYKKLRELETWKEEQAKREAKAREEAEQAAAERQRTEAAAVYRGQLTEGMKGSKHQLLQAMADDPLMLNAIMAIQQENWDGETTVTPEQALKMGVKGSRQSLEEELRGLYNRLHPYFGTAPVPSNVPGKKPAPKTSVVPPSKANGAAASPGKWNEAEWRKSFNRRMAEAAAAEKD